MDILASQDKQNRSQFKASTPMMYRKNKLAFVGCSNCPKLCCNGTQFNSARVLLDELQDVARFFPVVFQTDYDKKTGMGLLFSLKKGVPCPYLDSESEKCAIWDKGRPPVCRSYPFMFNFKTAEGLQKQFGIYLENKFCPGIKESSEGIRIFADTGEISVEILDKFFGREVLINYEKNLGATNEFLSLVAEFGLLVNAEIVVGKRPLPAGGFKDVTFPIFMISRQKLAALDTDSEMLLQSKGYINAINAHLNSLSNFRRLYEVLTAFEKSNLSVNMRNYTFGS